MPCLVLHQVIYRSYEPYRKFYVAASRNDEVSAQKKELFFLPRASRFAYDMTYRELGCTLQKAATCNSFSSPEASFSGGSGVLNEPAHISR